MLTFKIIAHKILFFLKVLFLVSVTFISLFIVFQKDFIADQICDCKPCSMREIPQDETVFKKFGGAFCACFTCSSCDDCDCEY